MGNYRFNNDGSLRTPDYVFSVDSLDDPDLQILREQVKEHNKETRKLARRNKWNRGSYHADHLQRVRIMPRGKRVEAAWNDYKSRRAYDSYLPIKHGEHFDVYVGKDTTAAYRMKQELETGLTSWEQQKISKLQYEIMLIESEGFKRKRGF